MRVATRGGSVDGPRQARVQRRLRRAGRPRGVRPLDMLGRRVRRARRSLVGGKRGLRGCGWAKFVGFGMDLVAQVGWLLFLWWSSR
ncbi:MAG TPA: hypothetical protein VMP86_00665, partial [Candidatus Binatia bacterium]|nr:hypothetical protein [Candidatus Binatia bacterium]